MWTIKSSRKAVGSASSNFRNPPIFPPWLTIYLSPKITIHSQHLQTKTFRRTSHPSIFLFKALHPHALIPSYCFSFLLSCHQGSFALPPFRTILIPEPQPSLDDDHFNARLRNCSCCSQYTTTSSIILSILSGRIPRGLKIDWSKSQTQSVRVTADNWEWFAKEKVNGCRTQAISFEERTELIWSIEEPSEANRVKGRVKRIADAPIKATS